MNYIKERSFIIKISEDNSNVSNNTYKQGTRDKKDNQRNHFTSEKKTPNFPEFFQVPTDLKEAIGLAYICSIKSEISEMSNIGLKLESTGKNYKKSENMWNDCLDYTRAFPKLNNMEKNDTDGASGKQL